MVSLGILTRIEEWISPNLVNQRDMALEKVHHLSQSLTKANQELLRLALENQRLQTLVDAARKPETPKVLRPRSAAEVRRLMERETLKGETDGV